MIAHYDQAIQIDMASRRCPLLARLAIARPNARASLDTIGEISTPLGFGARGKQPTTDGSPERKRCAATR